MLYEIALLPETFDASFHAEDRGRSVALKEVLRGLASNGLIADLHKSTWRKHILKQVETLPPKVRQDLVKSLDTLHKRNRLVRRPSSAFAPTCDRDWHQIAATTDNLHAIVVSSLANDNPNPPSDNMLALEEVLDSELWTNRPLSLTVAMQAQGYRIALTPLLRYARKLLLIDPYLEASRNYQPVIELCSELLGRGRGEPAGTIHIHAKHHDPKRGTASWFSDWRSLLEPLHTKHGHRFQVYLYEKPEAKGRQRFHDRFILTDQCGVSVPAGLSIVQSSSTDWHLMDHAVAEKHRAAFEGPVHPYLEHVAHEPLIIP